MKLRVIHYNDPEGRQLDLVRIVIRTIHSKVPADYKGPQILDVKQKVQFTRSQVIDDDGKKAFTSWHSSNPYWPEYDPTENITKYTTDTKIIKAEKVNPDTANVDITVQYFPIDGGDHQAKEKEVVPTGQKSTSTTIDKPKAVKSKPIVSKPEESQEPQDSAPRVKESQGSTPRAEKPQNQISRLEEPQRSTEKNKNKPNPKPAKHKEIVHYVKPFVAPREMQLIPLSHDLAYLRNTKEVSELLNKLRIVGYFYFKENKWFKEEFFDGVLSEKDL